MTCLNNLLILARTDGVYSVFISAGGRGFESRPSRLWSFFHRHSESTEYTVLYTHRCKGKIKSIVYHPTQEFDQPINYYEVTVINENVFIGRNTCKDTQYLFYIHVHVHVTHTQYTTDPYYTSQSLQIWTGLIYMWWSLNGLISVLYFFWRMSTQPELTFSNQPAFLDVSLCELAAQKEQEWRKLQELRAQSLEQAFREKDKQLGQVMARFKKLKEDFKYNLRLLSERDQELDRYDVTFSELRAAFQSKNAEVFVWSLHYENLHCENAMNSHFAVKLLYVCG